MNERQRQVAWLRTRATVLMLMRDALDAAAGKASETTGLRKASGKETLLDQRPRPVLILPNDPRFARRLLAGLVHRR